MKKHIFILVAASLSACSFPNKSGFEAEINDRIFVGMSAATAKAKLADMDLQCHDMDNSIHCSRPESFFRFRSAMFYTCIDNVTLYLSSDGHITSIEVPEFDGCMGGLG